MVVILLTLSKLKGNLIAILSTCSCRLSGRKTTRAIRRTSAIHGNGSSPSPLVYSQACPVRAAIYQQLLVFEVQFADMKDGQLPLRLLMLWALPR